MKAGPEQQAAERTANRCKTIDRVSRNSPLEIDGHQAAHTPVLTLARTTGRRQSFFLQQMIERGIGAMEEAWLLAETIARIRSGDVPQVRHVDRSTPDLFSSEDDSET